MCWHRWFRFSNYELDLSEAEDYNPLYTDYRICRKCGLIQRFCTIFNEEPEDWDAQGFWDDFCTVNNYKEAIEKMKNGRTWKENRRKTNIEIGRQKALKNIITVRTSSDSTPKEASK